MYILLYSSLPYPIDFMISSEMFQYVQLNTRRKNAWHDENGRHAAMYSIYLGKMMVLLVF